MGFRRSRRASASSYGQSGTENCGCDKTKLLRWENEATVVDQDIPTEVTLTRDEVDYDTSAVAPVMPTRIVTSFFEKVRTGDAVSVRLAGRITYAYSTLRRFKTETSFQVTSGP